MTDEGLSSSAQGKYASANGIDVYYEEHGSGPPLLLLHGGMATAQAWEPHVKRLASHFRVLIPDGRGRGRTRNPTGQLSYRLLTDDTAAFIQALGLEQTFVCGWSDGGQVALELGMRYPGIARACVVAGAWKEMSAGYFRSLRAIGFEAPGVVNLEQMNQTIPGMVAMWRELHAGQGADGWRELLLAISTLWLTPIVYTDADFARISTPTLILLGDRDEMIPVEQAVAMLRLIPGAELAIVPAGDHSLVRSKAEAVVNIVLEFLLRRGLHGRDA